MTDLRDQRGDEMIILSRYQDIGATLRSLRHTAGLTIRDLSARAHVSASAVSKRENHHGITAGALVEHAGALGYRLALIPARPGRRLTGTGWPT